jgi:hypothetical protein
MWAAWAAGFIILALIAEDFYNFFTGGKSLIGDLAKEFPIIGVELLALKDWFIENQQTIQEWGYLAIEIAKQIFNGFTVMGSYLYSLFSAMLPGAVSIFTIILNTILGTIQTIINVAMTLGSVFISVFSAIVSPLETVKSLMESLANGASYLVEKISQINIPGIGAIAGLLPGMGGGGSPINSQVTVNVGGSNASPSQIAGAVANGNKKSLRGELATAGRNNPKVKN